MNNNVRFLCYSHYVKSHSLLWRIRHWLKLNFMEIVLSVLIGLTLVGAL